MKEDGVIQECVDGFMERFGQAYLSEVEEFVHCILEKRRPTVTVQDGVESTRLAMPVKSPLKQRNWLL